MHMCMCKLLYFFPTILSLSLSLYKYIYIYIFFFNFVFSSSSIEADGQSEIVNVPIDVEDDKDDEDYNLSDFSESDDDINEDFGMEDDGINRAIEGKELEGVWNGEGDSDHGDSDELGSAKGSSDDERNSRPRFPEFNQCIGMENVQLVKDQNFASHVVFNEALKEWCTKEKHDFEHKHNDKWRVTAVYKKKKKKWLEDTCIPNTNGRCLSNQKFYEHTYVWQGS